MQDPLVSLEDFALRVPGGVQTSDEDRATARLQDASALVRSVAGDGSDDWSESGGNVPDVIQLIVIQVALRAFIKPESLASESTIVFTGSFSSVPSAVFLTKAEAREVKRAAGVTGGDLWVLRTTRADQDDAGTDIPDVPAPPGNDMQDARIEWP